MPSRKTLAARIAASLGWLALAGGCFAGAGPLVSRSWQDVDDANVRRQFFRIHGIDWDFIWSAIAFGTVVLTVLAMFACCVWMFALLLDFWSQPPGGDRARR